jgi:plasmid replication initiation protein
MTKAKGDYIVAQHHDLVEGKVIKRLNHLTVQDQRIIFTLISIIQPTDTEFHKQTISIAKFAELIGVKGNMYKYMKDVVSALSKKQLGFPTKNSKGIFPVNWFQHVKMEPEDGIVEFCFSEILKPYLLRLKDGTYTTFYLKNAFNLNSTYSMRVYELSKQWELRGSYRYPLSDFREIVGVPEDAYPLYADFKKRVLKTAINEINKKTDDLTIEFEEIKTGRKITGIEFTVKKKPKPKKESGKKKKQKEISE